MPSQLTKTLIATLGLIFSLPTFADLVLTAPPRETSVQGQEYYGPIAEYLTKKTGEKIVYKYPGSWEQYAADMRNDKYDIVFDGPHFAAWRIKHLQHKPLVKLRGNLKFLVVANAEARDIDNLDHLVSKKTCGIASPNLSMLTYLAQFADKPQAPSVLEITGGMPAVYKAFKAGKCDAMVLRDSFYKNKISAKDKEDLKIVYSSKPLPNQTITVSARVGKKTQKIIGSSLLEVQGARSAKKVLYRFSRKRPTFTRASANSYLGVEALLEGRLAGW